MIKKLSLIFVLACSIFGMVFADSNGVWHNAKDVRVGTFGFDEEDTLNPFKFINPVEINKSLTVNDILSISKNEGSLNLIGTDHTYLQFFPEGLVSGRQAWFGFGGAGNKNLYLANNNSGANLVLRTMGAGATVVEKNLIVAGAYVKAKSFADGDDMTYFLDPSGTSNISRIKSALSTIPLTDDELVTKGYVDSNDNVDDADSDSSNEIQVLSKSGTTVTLSKGGGSVSIRDADSSTSNEIQALSKSGTTVTLSKGGGSVSIADNDNSATNEIQALSKSGTTITLSNGGGSVSIADNDNSATNEYPTAGTGITVSGRQVSVNTGTIATRSYVDTKVSSSGGGTLSCTTVTVGTSSTATANCAAGYTMTGGGFLMQISSGSKYSMPTSNGWTCHSQGVMVTCYARCCKII